MKKLLKIAAILLLALVLVLGIAVGVVFYNIDSLAKRGIQEGGTYALGVPTTVDSVSLHIFSGGVSLSGLNIANPSGFAAPHFLNLKKGSVSVSMDSLKKDVVEIPALKLTGIDVNLQRTPDGSNYGTIIDHLKKLKGSPKPSSSGEKRFIIRDLTIENVSIHADMLAAPGQIGKVVNSAAAVNVPIERIQLQNVGQTGTGVGGTGVTMEELSSIIVQAVLAAAADKGYGTIPGQILSDIQGAVSSLGDLKQIPVAVIGTAGEAAKQIGGALENVGKAAGDTLNNVGKSITDGIGGLLGGDKDKKDDKSNPPKKP